MTNQEKIATLNEWLKNSKNIVFFGGAGVSTESGIPDFRSADGLYNTPDVNFTGYDPEYLLSFTCLHYNPNVFFEFYRQKLDCRNIEPNITHKKLAEWEQKGRLVSVITQNIDGLHQKAGSKNVREIHGTTLRNYCRKCGKPYPANYIFEYQDGLVPKCKCGGVVRPAVTLYEEQLPEDAWYEAASDIRTADLLIVAGSSMTVWPAASLVEYAPKDCRIAVINRDPISLSRKTADLEINANLGDVFSQLEV